MLWSPGHRFKSRPLEIVENLRAGGYGITYKARNLRLNNFVVLKIPIQKSGNYPKLCQDFLKEAQRLARLSDKSHPNIVRVSDYFEEDGLPCMVMDLIPGENLYHLVQMNGAFLEEQALKYIKQIGSALSLCHELNIIHRDAHPGNILIHANNGNAILIDFGISGTTLTSRNSHTGNRAFAPWEQGLDSEKDKTPQIDIHTLAASLYYLVTGETPSPSSGYRKHYKKDLIPPKKLNSHLSDCTNQAILKGMALESEDRPKSMDDWLKLLEPSRLNLSSKPFNIDSNENSPFLPVDAGVYKPLELNLSSEFSSTNSGRNILPSSVDRTLEPRKRKRHINRTFKTRRNFFAYTILASGGLISLLFTKRFFSNDEAREDAPKVIESSETELNREKEAEEPTTKDIANNKISRNKLDFEIVNVNRYGVIIRQENRSANYYVEDLGNNISLKMVSVAGGKFQMGWPKATEVEKSIRKYDPDSYKSKYPSHEVTVPSFHIGQHLVTQAQYKAIIGTNPSRYRENNNHPVESIFWDDAVKFCQKLSEKTGKTYKLPSEAQWEYACRAGTRTPFYFGETLTSQLANYRGTETYANEPKGIYREKTTPVGIFLPNNFGLYDMHGNVWEWCEDNWHDSYENAPKDGSAWLSEDDSFKVIRGGSLNNTPGDCRSFYRTYKSRRGYDNSNIGFRVICINSNAT